MGIKKTILVFVLLLACFLSFSQDDDVVGIVLDKDKGDALVIGDKTINKASVYGKEEDVLQFLINDKYIHHRMDDAVNYYFPLVRSQSENCETANSDKKIYILLQNKKEYLDLYEKLNPEHNGNYNNSFALKSVNNINIIVTNNAIDSNEFHSSLDIVKLLLQKDKTDILKIAGQEISEVTIYGTKDDLIHFLINDKYVVHRYMPDQGSKYKFMAADEMSEQFNNINNEEKNLSKKILIIIDNPEEYKAIVQRNSSNYSSNKSLIHLDKINNLNIFVTSNIKR